MKSFLGKVFRCQIPHYDQYGLHPIRRQSAGEWADSGMEKLFGRLLHDMWGWSAGDPEALRCRICGTRRGVRPLWDLAKLRRHVSSVVHQRFLYLLYHHPEPVYLSGDAA
jgi:hypothetical protein